MFHHPCRCSIKCCFLHILSIILQNSSDQQNLWNLLGLGKICMEHGARLNLFLRSWRSKWEIMAINSLQPKSRRPAKMAESPATHESKDRRLPTVKVRTWTLWLRTKARQDLNPSIVNWRLSRWQRCAMKSSAEGIFDHRTGGGIGWWYRQVLGTVEFRSGCVITMYPWDFPWIFYCEGNGM